MYLYSTTTCHTLTSVEQHRTLDIFKLEAQNSYFPDTLQPAVEVLRGKQEREMIRSTDKKFEEVKGQTGACAGCRKFLGAKPGRIGQQIWVICAIAQDSTTGAKVLPRKDRDTCVRLNQVGAQ